jgi:virulence-associated protein VagC
MGHNVAKHSWSFRLARAAPGRQTILRIEGHRLVLEPIGRPSLLAVSSTLKRLDEDFPQIKPLPAKPVDL